MTIEYASEINNNNTNNLAQPPSKLEMMHARNHTAADWEDWERLSGEQRTRSRLKNVSGITEDLIDSAIVATVLSRARRSNNTVITMPIVNQYGQVCCCIICSKTPVASAFALCKYRQPMPKSLDITFISFICHKHTNDHQLSNKNKTNNSGGVFWKLLEIRNEILAPSRL